MKLIKDNLGKIFLGITLIIVFLLGRSCNKTITKDSKVIIDTLILHKVDTIRDTLTIIKIKLKPIVKDSIKVLLDSSMFSGLSYKRIYHNTYRDSNIVINSIDTTIGYQLDKTINYKLLVPLRIYDSTKVIIRKDSLVFKPSKTQLSIGLIASPKMIAPTIDLKINKSTYMIGYDPINNKPMIGYKYLIWSSKR